MAQYQASNSFQSATLRPDDFVNKALMNCLEFSVETAKNKDADSLDKYDNNFIFLVNQAESVCSGCGYIQRTKGRVDLENLSEGEKSLLDGARVFFREKYTNHMTGNASAEGKARALLSEVVEGPFNSKVAEKRKELEIKILNPESGIKIKDIELILAHYRFELLLEAVTANKAVKKELEI